MYECKPLQGAVVETGTLAVFQSEGSCTETRTSCILFFVNGVRPHLAAALRMNLNLSELEHSRSKNRGLARNEQVVTRVPHFTTYTVSPR